MILHRILPLLTIIIALPLVALGAHKELGAVNWLRNYDAAQARSIKQDKPILLLFQEVPGCQGCVDYGEWTLSEPIIVDAIEHAFVPVAIFNNAGGHDREVLKRFKEPAWNYQVMRFLNSASVDIIPRKDKVWEPIETAQRMVAALEQAEQPVPDYLRTLAWSGPSASLETAAFRMSCFWVGEAKLGGIDGVVTTEAGWLDGHEVVRLRYDPSQLTWESLVAQAQAVRCASTVYAPDEATLAATPGKQVKLFTPAEYRSARESDQKRYLGHSRYKALSLNAVQRTKINAALSAGDIGALRRWLPPSQHRLIQP